jgi:hypothetical protein
VHPMTTTALSGLVDVPYSPCRIAEAYDKPKERRHVSDGRDGSHDDRSAAAANCDFLPF